MTNVRTLLKLNTLSFITGFARVSMQFKVMQFKVKASSRSELASDELFNSFDFDLTNMS